MRHEKNPADLRMRAEEALRVQTENLHELSTQDIESLVHELQVLQIELEMQNEELRRAQNELEDSRRKYSDLYDSAPIGYFIFDKNGLILDVNLTGARKLGVERKFLIKKPFSLYVTPEDKDAFYLHLRRVFGTRSSQICELKLAGKDGSQFDAQLDSLLVQDGDGKSSQCRTAVSDITERKLAEVKLQKSEEQFRASVENLLDAFGIYSAVRDQSGRIIDFRVEYVNNAACDSNLMTKEEQIGKNLLELLPAHRGSGLFDKYCLVVETGKPLTKDSLIYEDSFGDGRRLKKAVDIRVTKLGDGFIAAWRDVTERNRALEAIRESEERYRNLVESANDIIATVSSDGTITSLNPAFERITGWTREEWLGKSFQPLIHPDDLPKASEVFQHTMSGETMPGSELRLLANSGGYVYVEYVTTPLFKDGKVIGNLNVVRDITERKRAQEALSRAHDELEIRVEERTEELLRVNESLQAEIKERQQAEELNKAFNNISLTISSTLDSDEIMQRVIVEAAGAIGAETAAISLRKAGSWIVSYAYGFPQELVGTQMNDEEEPHAMLALKTKKPVAIDDAYNDERVNREHMKKHGICSVLVVPLLTGGKTIGVIFFNYHTSTVTFTGAQVDFANKLATSISLALENAYLFKEQKRIVKALHNAHDKLELRVQERTAELEESNKKLLESEEKYRELAESIGEVFYAMDRELRYTYWNNASEALTGILAKNAIGKSLFELFPELEGTRTEKLYREVLGTQQPRRFVSKYRVGDKNLFFEINAYPSRLGISIIAKDVTERKRAEEQIREQATLLDKARDAIEVRDLEDRLIYWNKSAERMYGWTAGEAIGKNANEFLYKEESQQLIEAQKNVLEKGEWAGELYQVTKEGKEIIVESHWTLVNDDERRPKSILIINTDITEKKKLESQFLRAQRMESIGTLAGGIAHDLNNVLTPMMLSLQLLKEKFTDEQSQRLLSILERNSQRGANLIKQVMTFARGIEGERVALQLAPLISEISKIIKETFPKSIEIQTKISKDLWTISGDVTQLHQVLMNLCVNARDAMPDGGTLSIFAENLFVDENHARISAEARAGPYIVITVSDTGTGIPPEILDRIFEPFFTTKEHGKGTGLGLSTTLAIVKGHGGFLVVDSKVKKGTTFKVYLPAVKTVKAQNVEEQQLEFPSEGKGLILVVDDEDSVRDVTREALEKSKFKVITANDGAEAVKLYSQNRHEIKAVLMDMMMPVMDGQTSIRELRTVNPGVKIIAVSGLIERDKLAKVADTYIDAFLTKPYTTEKLLKTISEVLSIE